MDSEAQWVAKRRAAVDATVSKGRLSSLDEIAAVAVGATESSWKPEFQKEVSFNEAKRRQKMADAYENGFLLQHEGTDETLEVANAQRARNAKNDRDRANRLRNLQKTLQPPRGVRVLKQFHAHATQRLHSRRGPHYI